jgi:predicted nucleic acid-binding protein
VDYIDTSALIKGYVTEPGSQEFIAWFSSSAIPCISPLSSVEFKCAIHRRARAGDFSRERSQAILARLNKHLVSSLIEQMPWPPGVFAGADDILDRVSPVPLRTLDALHLAVALHYRCNGFATADRVQAEAAQILGLPPIRF